MKLGAGNVLELKQTPVPMPEDGFNQDWCLATPKVRVKFPTEPCTPEMPDISSVTQDILKVSHLQPAEMAILQIGLLCQRKHFKYGSFFFPSPLLACGSVQILSAHHWIYAADLKAQLSKSATKRRTADCSHNTMTLLTYFLISTKHF